MLPFPDQNQLFRSGRTFTFKQANNDDDKNWDEAVVQHTLNEWRLSAGADVLALH